MQDIHSQVISQADFDANPIFATLGAKVGDTLDITRPDAPVVAIGDVCTLADGVTPGTMQDDGTGTGTLVCVATPAPAPEPAPAPAPTAEALGTDAKVGDTCTTTDGKPGTFAQQGDLLVCVPN